jgi:hypothetical protein
MSVSHLTLARVLAFFPPHMKFRTIAYLVAHSGIGVPTGHHVPHGCEQDLVCN